MKSTAFTHQHIALGAKMAAFAGYNMPITLTMSTLPYETTQAFLM
jgi:glycine cleavage system aminomethyltransferase T